VADVKRVSDATTKAHAIEAFFEERDARTEVALVPDDQEAVCGQDEGEVCQQ
jgi:hypothetical protein